MKKLGLFFGSILAAVSILFFMKFALEQERASSVGVEVDAQKPLYIFNWGDYIDPELIKEFEEKTGYSVVYETFDSNDAMEAKLKQGGTPYDLIFPSESRVPKLLEENLLKPLDKSKIIGLETLSPALMNQNFDRDNQYTIPYFWGTIGIMVNTEMVDAEKITTWKDLWDSEYKNNILVLDNFHEMLGLTLQSMGYSLNTQDEEKIKEATQRLIALSPNIRAVLTDEIKPLLVAGEAAIGIGYSGDAAAVIASNPAITYIIPKDGSAVWTDNFAIPHTAKNIEGAYAFINFMLEPEHAAKNAEYVGYTTPSQAARELLPEEMTSDTMFYPSDDVLNELEHYEHLGKHWIEFYNEQFLNFKMELS
ncbi:extracellular solute-binding protein [Granulicatella sp. zg-ZJ]|uniref:ABC transporter substrate-binding protein n=1 Tax=unclassified Granulicatella TaxID=2630493 RepID=UPI0013C1D2A1|nr:MULTISPECIES: spermidine/putrescine ABC transporter substrate-binding protein [unclassified Granulicatella]MBS4750146.1 spermidine/putrescine ABC transporter substrate-binding protein [Carnobacteriaceae bacterium zg-ZUI78]NEW62349.1 extracellular solute-binding protein [Granulicatella sp. zg-ZJ]NEW65512.1 extracellular solute-binding protein [Granulicatella sp. zg-84]QMI85603.1 spermidine/putrescine ABC transporter substrate-binding protein [Carnobacteriaceae bacterium zg-84]